MNKITFRERRLIEETIKAFLNQEWCITPEAIWGFLEIHEEPVDFEKVAYILQEQQAEGTRR